MLACARCKLWWMTPEWRTSTLKLPPETQFLLVELKGSGEGISPGAYAILLPLIDGDFRTTLRAGRCVSPLPVQRIQHMDVGGTFDFILWGAIIKAQYMGSPTRPWLPWARGATYADLSSPHMLCSYRE